MDKMFKKSQAAMEFLMTYGWAILVVLVAIGALAYFGVLSPDKFLPAKCQLPAGIACTDFRVSSDTGVSVVLRNSIGFDMDNLVVRVGGCTSDLSIVGGITTLRNGDDATWTGTAVDCGLTGKGGDKFKEAFGFQYRNTDSELSHAVNGTITGRVE